MLDANVLIDANRDYYPLERVPEFWDWLLYVGKKGQIKIPIEIYEEIRDGKKDSLSKWARRLTTKSALLLDEEVRMELVQRATTQGYAPDLTDVQMQGLGRDPFLVAYALVMPSERIVVTTEVSKPTKQGHNRRLPDVCRDFGIVTCTTFDLIKELDFHTGWKPDPGAFDIEDVNLP